MAKRELRGWHYQATTALAIVTLLLVIAFFAQTFRSFFLTDRDPVLVAIERVQQKRQTVDEPAIDEQTSEEQIIEEP